MLFCCLAHLELGELETENGSESGNGRVLSGQKKNMIWLLDYVLTLLEIAISICYGAENRNWISHLAKPLGACCPRF